MALVRGLLVALGLVAILVGSQLAWGEVDVNGLSVPLEFFLNVEQLGTIVAVIGSAVGLLGLSGAVSDRAVGALIVFVGAAVAVGAIVVVGLIDGARMQLDPAFAEVVSPSAAVVGPAGFVVAAGGALLIMGGLLTLMTPAPEPPPPPSGGPIGPTPPGWYPAGRDVRYWTGTRWSSAARRLT